MNEILQDLKFGLRTLLKSPGFAFVALSTIGVAIGANAAIFSFVDGLLLKNLPYDEPDRIVRVLEKPPGGGRNGISTLNYLDWASQNTVFEYMAGQSWGTSSLTGVETPIQVPCEQVSVHFWDIFRVTPFMGRNFVEGEDQPGREHVALINNSFWVSQFGADPKVLGRVMILDGEPYTIIGVLPPGRTDLTATKIWRPLAFPKGNLTRDFHWFQAWARLKRGVSQQQAQTQMDAIAIRIAHDYPKSNKGWGVGLDTFPSVTVNPYVRISVLVLMGAVGMVLLIGCANLANLTLARGVSRQREVAIRAALGAGRWRLMRQLLTESLLLSVGGGALGVLVAYGGLAALKATMPGGMLPPNVQVEMDARVLLFVLGLSLLTGVLFGIVPAFKATRGDLAESIKEGALGMSSGSSSHVFRGTLVVSEVALAFVLLAGAGLLIRSFLQMQVVETGFDSTGVVTAYLPISPKRFHTAEELKAYLHRITDAVGSVAGVRDVAVTSALPLRGWGYGMPFQVVGAKDVDVANRPDCFFKMVGPSYFRALGIRLVKGRSLNEHDVKGSPPVTVINETMAKKFFPDKNPIGERIRIEEIAYGETKLGPEIPWEIVGVIADEKVGYLGGSNDDSPGVYVTYEQSPQTGQALVVRGATESPLLQKSIRNAIHEVNKDQIVDDMETLEQIKHESVGYDRFRSALMGIFAGIALVLAAMGLYGVISYSVLQRTREIGIRSVLGASPGNILRLVLRNGLTLTATGLVIGIGASFVLAQFLSSMLFNVGKYDPATFSAVAGLMLLIAAAACLIPARRAMRVDPIVALRYE